MKAAPGFATTAGACALVSMTLVAPAADDGPTTTPSRPSLEDREAAVQGDAAPDAWFALRSGQRPGDDDPEAGSPAAQAQSQPTVSGGSAPTLVRAEARR